GAPHSLDDKSGPSLHGVLVRSRRYADRRAGKRGRSCLRARGGHAKGAGSDARGIALAQCGTSGCDGFGRGLASDKRISMSEPAFLPATQEERKAQAQSWFADLQGRICAEFEAIERDYSGAPGEQPGRFHRKNWRRPTEDNTDGG